MNGIHYPSFVSAVNFDRAIRMGEVPTFTVQCTNCGAMGMWNDWIGDAHAFAKLCPSCGRYSGGNIK